MMLNDVTIVREEVLFQKSFHVNSAATELSGVNAKLATTAKVVAALIKHGHLKAITVTNPVNRCPIVVVPAGEVGRFAREYVSLFAIAKQRRRHFMAVKKELQDAAVEPVFNPRKIGATFYRRIDMKSSIRSLS